MSGFITKTEVQKCSDHIIKAYGVVFYAICLDAEGETFLGLLIRHGLA